MVSVEDVHGYLSPHYAQLTMIRLILQGGLGNQMFEYASAYAIARHTNQPLLLDMSFFETYKGREWCRPYELSIFALHEQSTFVSGHQLEVKALPKLSYWCRRHNINRCGKYIFLPTLLKRRSQVLFGYFVNYHFFEYYRHELLQAFAFRSQPNTANQRYLNDISSIESVSVHIRRGDYLNNTNAGIFWHPDVEWYWTAMREMEKQVHNPTYYFFSDDIAWAREQFADVKNAVFVDINHGADAYNDMRLMSQCKHNIIANSTFSWWGAWLNKNPNKIVIAPEKYYVDDAANIRYRNNMILPNWYTI